MHKIGIYTDPSGLFLIIETPQPLQFELRDASGKLLITGNKLRQPLINVNIKRLVKGTYTVNIYIDGHQVQKTIEL